VWLFVLNSSMAGATTVAFVLQGLVLVIAIGLVLLARAGALRRWTT
jgi:hypothetical protein